MNGTTELISAAFATRCAPCREKIARDFAATHGDKAYQRDGLRVQLFEHRREVVGKGVVVISLRRMSHWPKPRRSGDYLIPGFEKGSVWYSNRPSAEGWTEKDRASLAHVFDVNLRAVFQIS